MCAEKYVEDDNEGREGDHNPTHAINLHSPQHTYASTHTNTRTIGSAQDVLETQTTSIVPWSPIPQLTKKIVACSIYAAIVPNQQAVLIAC